MAIRSLVRHHKSPCEQAQILAAYERGQGTQEEVAAQHGIAVSTLQRWLHQSGTEPAVNVPPLVELPSLEPVPKVARTCHRCAGRVVRLEEKRTI